MAPPVALQGLWFGLDGLATVALKRGELSAGARLAAASDQLRSSIGGDSTLDLVGFEPALHQARRLMDPVEFERAAAEGRALGERANS